MLVAAGGWYAASRHEPPSAPPTPGPVVVRSAAGPVVLQPWAWCLAGSCVDSGRPEQPPSVGSPRAVEFTHARDWDFRALFRSGHAECPRELAAPVRRVGDGRYRITPVGHPGAWSVDLVGRGQGDLTVTFRWHTARVGALPARARGRLSVWVERKDGDWSGARLTVSDLDRRPRNASARLLVTGTDGRTAALTLDGPEACSEQGRLDFVRSARGTGALGGLGPPPYDYRVRLVLDGTRYVGRGTWPADARGPGDPAVTLRWSPPLPVYDGTPDLTGP